MATLSVPWACADRPMATVDMRSLKDDVLKLQPAELETLLHRWAFGLKSRYHSAERVGQSSDRGLDVTGFLTASRFEGPWHNFQCKQLARTLTPEDLFGELGKTLYYASRGEFTSPSRYVFVAPTGLGNKARAVIGHPSRFKKTMLEEWDSRCARKVKTSRTPIPMDDALRETIGAFDFENIEAWNADRILVEPSMAAVLIATFEIDPGAAPEHPVPEDWQDHESTYVDQLVGVYGDHSGKPFAGPDAALASMEHGMHLRDQRVRYFAAADFKAHFKESVLDGLLSELDENVYHGVVDGLHALTGLARVDSAMRQAAVLDVPGPFGKHKRATVKVRQGTCHHLVNAGRLKWRS